MLAFIVTPPPQFGIRITGYLDRWIELSETSLSYEGIRDLLIREQTLGVGSAELRVFIEERTPGSFKEMCNIAEQYLKAHRPLSRKRHCNRE